METVYLLAGFVGTAAALWMLEPPKTKRTDGTASKGGKKETQQFQNPLRSLTMAQDSDIESVEKIQDQLTGRWKEKVTLRSGGICYRYLTPAESPTATDDSQ